MSNKSFTIRPFEKLKKKIGSKQVVPTLTPVRQKKKEQFTDDELFNNAMDDVQEIEAFRMLNCDRYHPKDFSASIRPDSDREVLTVLCDRGGAEADAPAGHARVCPVDEPGLP